MYTLNVPDEIYIIMIYIDDMILSLNHTEIIIEYLS